MTGREWGLMGVLAILWGVSFFFSNVALAARLGGHRIPLLGLALLSTALGFVIYFRVLATAGATNVMLVTLLMPIVALLLGSLILHEPVTATALAGMALIFAGLLAIDGRLLRARRVAVAPPSSSSKAA
jgi:drug/metabolite transporter (DMT)-like permease